MSNGNKHEDELSNKGWTISQYFKDSGIFKEIIKYALPVSIFFATIAVIWPLKWALGIVAIEEYLSSIQSDLSSSEDTIFNYTWDFSLDEQYPVLAQIGIDNLIEENEAFLINYPLDTNLIHDDISRAGRINLFKTYSQIWSSFARNFPFASTGSAQVSLTYNMKCQPRGVLGQGRIGLSQKPIAYDVKINGKLLPNYSSVEDRSIIISEDEYLSRNNVESAPFINGITMHTLQLEVFPKPLEGQAVKGISSVEAILEGIKSCSFNAMVFVRDQPREFVRSDVITMIEGWYHGK